MLNSLYGFEIVLSGFLPKETKWIFPKDRFVEWRKEDESYCRWAGFGHEIELPVMYRIGKILLVNEVAYNELMKYRTDIPKIHTPGSIAWLSV